jgi:hypothetical protein
VRIAAPLADNDIVIVWMERAQPACLSGLSGGSDYT